MAPDAAPVLEIRGLRRAYGRFRKIEAVRGVSLAVRRGEIFGLIGPDGAGKTSIIQTLAGVLRPHGGSASVHGLDVASHADEVKRRVGYMPQGLGSNLYDSLTVHENIEFFRDLRRLPPEVYRANRAELLAATRLEPFLDRRAVNLSGGMRQKLALVCTLIHLPDVLLLDEPTTGVDPISRQEFWQIVRRVVDERGTTVLLTTSYMDEAERCHRIALVHDGRIVAEGTPAGIRQRASGRFARLVADPQRSALRLLRARTDVISTQVFGDAIHVEFEGDLRAIDAALGAEGIAIRELAMVDPGLEDVFLQLIGRDTAPRDQVGFDRVDAVSAAPSIQCRGVSRAFGSFTAVAGVDLTVSKGEIFGLLGPNGAGKTTLIRMMCGLLEPSAGTISIAGVDVRAERGRIWTAIGYMSQRFSLYRDLTVRQNLRLYADLYGVDRATYSALAARLGLDAFASRLTSDLPTGVRQRVSLLCAVIHRPRIVFLDEPTSGVDPRARRVFWDLIYALSRDAGVTVLVSTHYMDEAAHCDRLGLMDEGRLIAVGSPAALEEQSERRSGRLLSIQADDPHAAYLVVKRTHPLAVRYGAAIHVRSRDCEEDRAALATLLGRANIGGVRIARVPLSMDETFVDFVNTAESARA